MKIKHVLYAVAAVLTALLLIVLLPIDDALDGEAAAWMQSANDTQDVKGNGYYYLMGIAAAPAAEPEAAGKELVEAYRRAEQEFLGGQLAEFPPLDSGHAEAELPLPDGDYYCRLREAGCYPRLAANAAALRAELQTHAVLVERYQHYLRFGTVKPLVQASMYERFPAYSHLMRGQKLNQFRIVLGSLSGQREQALSLLREDIIHVRRQLAEARNLISKMIALNMLTDNLDLLLWIAQPANSHGTAVTPLTPQERSLEPAMAREFGGGANFFRLLDEHPAYIGNDDKFSERLLVATVKPNMTLNSLFSYYRSIAVLSLADAVEFRRIVTTDPPHAETGFNLRNIGGWILASVSAPSLIEYVARMHDVDCKIALVNAALPLDAAAWADVMDGARVLEAANPYAPAERPRPDPETGTLCFDGPLPDEQGRRCIRVPTALPER